MLSTLLLSACLLGPQEAVQDPLVCAADRWPGFRGLGTSHSAASDLPTSWSDEHNLAWSVELEGLGQSSPVIFDGHAYATSVVGAQKEHGLVHCVSLADGAVQWVRRFEASALQESSEMIARGAPTPWVDAAGLVVLFESGDLWGLNHAGEPQWHRALLEEYGAYAGNHGLAASVIATAGEAAVLIDHDGPSYLLQVERSSGETRWRAERSSRISWSTPVMRRTASGETQLVVSSMGSVDGYRWSDGERVWSLEGVEGNTVPSPTAVGEWVYVASNSVSSNQLLAPEAGTEPHTPALRWTAGERARPSSFGSPLVAGGRVYLVNRSGVLSALELSSGELAWTHRLPESVWAAPSAADGKLWFFGREGTSAVLLDRGQAPEVIATNTLTVEDTVYGVGFVEGAILLRTGSRLLCLREQP